MAIVRFCFVALIIVAIAMVASARSGVGYYGQEQEGMHKHKPAAPVPAAPGPPYPAAAVPASKEERSTIIAVQGLIYCKSGSKLMPLKGAVARVRCLAVDKESGYESDTFSVLSTGTNEKGYFFVTLSPSELHENWKLKECKAFLDSSPSKNCKIPTNDNNGLRGALLSSHRPIGEKNVKLYSVGPFAYTSPPSQPKPSVPRGSGY